MNSIFKKTVAVLLTIVMLVSVFSTAVFAADISLPDDYIELILDESAAKYTTKGDERVWFAFTAPESNQYVFESFAENDTWCHLYDSQGNFMFDDDDGGSDGNFRLSHYLEEGETYYLLTQFYSGYTGKMSVMVSFDNASEPDFPESEPEFVGFTVSPDTLYIDEYTNGEWVDDGEGQYFRYDWERMLSGITLELPDGSTQYCRLNTSGYKPQFQYGDAIYMINSDVEQDYYNQWQGGDIRDVNLWIADCFGNHVYSRVNIEICGNEPPVIEETIESISIEPITIDAMKNGRVVTVYDENDEEINYYQYDKWYKAIKTVEATLTSGNIVELPVICEDYYSPRFEYNGESYNLWIDNIQSYEERWLIGNTYTVRVSWGYGSVDVEVTIGEAEELVLDQMKEIEYESYGDYYFAFKPEKSAIYHFQSFEGERDPYGAVLNSSLEELAYADNENGWDFSLKYYLEEGETYYLRVYTRGDGIICPVMISEYDSPIESITFEPLRIVEYTKGYECEYYAPNSEECIKYYSYNWWNWFKSTIITKDGQQYDGWGTAFSIEDEYFHLQCDTRDQSYEDRWLVGNTYYVTVSLFGQKYELPVTIEENPIESIEFNPVTIYDGFCNGWEYEGWNETTGEYISYYRYEYENKIPYTVTMKDGTVINGRGTWFYHNDDGYQVDFYDNQYDVLGWKFGETYTVTASVLGKSYNIPVTLQENPIEKIEFNPITLVENVDGYWSYGWSEETEEWVDYYRYSYDKDLIYNIYLKDGTVQSGNVPEDGYIEFFDEWHYVSFEDNQSAENAWKKGNTYTVDIELLGQKAKLEVSIEELSVPEIPLDEDQQITISEQGERAYLTFIPEVDGMYIYESIPMECDIYGGIYDSNMNSIDGNYWGFKMEVELQAGKKYYLATWHDYGPDFTYTIKISRAPYIESIEIPDINVFENSNGYYTTAADGSEYYYYSDWHWQIPYVYITMNTGETYKSYAGKSNSELCFWCEETCKDYFPEISFVQDDENRWVAGNTYTATIIIGDATATANINILESPIESFEIKPISITEKTQGSFEESWNPETEEYEEYYRYWWWNSVSYTIKFKNGDVINGQGDGFEYNNAWYDFERSDNQSAQNSWSVGNTYYETVSIMGFSAEAEISITQLETKELTLNEMQQVEISEYGQSVYFSFTPQESGVYRFESFADDQDTYGHLYNSDMQEIAYNDDKQDDSNFRIDYELKAGETYYYRARYYRLDRTGSFPVKLSIAPKLIGINFEKVEIYENTNGYFTTASDGSEYYYYSDWYWQVKSVILSYSNGEKIRCNINRGSSEIGFNYQGQWYPLEFTAEQDEDNRWVIGETYVAQVSIMGGYAQVEVEIIESPVESITVEPISIIEYTEGSYIPDWDENGDYCEYFAYNWRDQLRYTINFKNGSQVTGHGGYFSYKGKTHEIICNDTQNSIANAWTIGNTYNATITAMGYSADVSVSIIDTPVESVVVKPLAIVSETNGGWSEYWDEYSEDWIRYFYYDWFNHKDFSCIVTFKDGTTQEVKESFEYNGTEYQIWRSENQGGYNPWIPGNTYYPTVTVLGVEAQVEVSILDQNIENGIKYIVQNGCAIVTGVTDSGIVLEIPTTLGDYPVTAISSISGGDYAEIVIPDSVTALSDGMFGSYCDGLRKITLGAGIKALNNRIFANAYDLQEIVVSENNPEYTSVDGIVYDKLVTKMVAIPQSKTTDHIVPSTVTDIELYMRGTYKFRLDISNADAGYVYEDGVLYNKEKTIIYKCDTDKTGSYVMPDTVEKISNIAFMNSSLTEVTVSNKVEDIVYYAFAESKNLEKVVLPDTLTSISRNAFDGCSNLSDINIPSSLTTLGQCAFKNSGILKANIPGSVQEIGYEAFANSALNEITLAEGIEAIGSGAFERTKIKTVKIPNSTKYIDSFAFYGSELEEIDLGTGVEYISIYAFAKTNIASVYIPNSVKTIDKNAFEGSKVTNLEFQEGITRIDEYAFRKIEIESIDFPESVTDITYKCFEDCKNLMNIDLPDNLENLDGFAFHGSAWYESQPDGVVYLEDALYHYKGEMEKDAEIVVENGTKIIANFAFGQYLEETEEYSNLKSITIPNTVKIIGSSAFAQCYGLTDVYYVGTEQQAKQIDIGVENEYLLDAEWHYITCVHSWKDATCGEPKTCELCGETEGEALGHSYNNGVETKAPTCTEIGVKTFTCGTCGDSYTETIDALGHDWKDATCVAPKTCEVCGETEGKPLGHSYNGVETKAPTCTETGVKTFTCGTCGDSYTETIDALGHDWKDATCVAPKTCELCGETDGEALGHSYNNGVETKAPTCTETGVKTFTCGTCGDSYTETIDALGHDWKDATCVAPKTCEVCGDTDGKPLGHSWKNATCTEPKTCTVCGDTEGKPLSHNSNNGTVVKAATCSAEGERVYTCTSCGEVLKTETISKLIHTYDNNCDTNCNVCGEVRAINHQYKSEWSFDEFEHWYECSICANKKDVASHDFDSFEDTQCNICNAIVERLSTNGAKYVIENVTGTIGTTVDVYVSIENNPGIVTLKNKIVYDTNALELIAVTDCKLLEGYSQPAPTINSPYTIGWINSQAKENNVLNGNIVKLTFKIKDGIAEGNYDISIQPVQSYDKDGNKIYFEGAKASVKAVDYIAGDVDGNGEVNDWDAIVLRRYLVDWKVTIDIDAADVDANGEVDDWDAVILERYLAGWNVELKA